MARKQAKFWLDKTIEVETHAAKGPPHLSPKGRAEWYHALSETSKLAANQASAWRDRRI